MNWEAVIAIAEVLSLVIGVVTFVLVTRKADRNELEIKTQAIIDARFQNFATKMEAVVDGWDKVMQNIKERLARGDKTFDELENEHQELEVQSAVVHGSLQKWALETFGTKDQVAELLSQIQETQVRLASFEASLKACQHECAKKGRAL